MFHIFLHFLVPAIIAFGIVMLSRNGVSSWNVDIWSIDKSQTVFIQWGKVLVWLLLSLLIDLDHLLADPIYDPERCSIGFHPLHSTWPIIGYIVMCFVPKLRLLGLGLVIHILLDASDCMA